MNSIYGFLNSLYQNIKLQSKQHISFPFVILLLLTLPLGYAVSSIAMALLVISFFIARSREPFSLNIYFLLPTLLYGLMAASVFWSIDEESTLDSLSKQLPFLLIPLAFWFGKNFLEKQKEFILKAYSLGIALYCIVFLVRAVYRFIETSEMQVFFYHELVTLDLNAVHFSLYSAVAYFYLLTRIKEHVLNRFLILVIGFFIVILSSKNIIFVFLFLNIVWLVAQKRFLHSRKFGYLVLLFLVFVALLIFTPVKERFLKEVNTNITENTVVIEDAKAEEKVYNVSVRQAWTNDSFQPNYYFPGTAFRVYQARIFFEMMEEDYAYFHGYGSNATSQKIKEKAEKYNLEEGYGKFDFHNQYLQYVAEVGIFGLVLFLGMILLTFYSGYKKKDFLIIAFIILVSSLFVTESLLLRQRGIIFFIVLYCLFNSRTSNNKAENKILEEY